jgi:hypothetical protein
MKFIVQAMVTSNPIVRLPAIKRCSTAFRARIAEASHKLAVFLAPLLDTYDATQAGQPLLDALVAYLQFPAHIITLSSLNTGTSKHFINYPEGLSDGHPACVEATEGRVRPDARPNPPWHKKSLPLAKTEDDLKDDTVARAAKAIHAGKIGAAHRMMVSAGLAPRTQANMLATHAMHKPTCAPLELVTQMPCAQLSVTVLAMHRRLKRDAGSNKSIDNFGWAPDLLLPQRGHTLTLDSLSFQVARLHCAIFTSDLPIEGALLVTAGKSTSLFKDGPTKRKADAALGKPPRLRAVVSGTLILRTSLSEANKTPSGKRAHEELSKYNLALGVKSGPEKVAFSMRAAYAAGAVIGQGDFENGFGNIHRDAMLRAVGNIWPEATQAFQAFYGQASYVLLDHVDADGHTHITIALSGDGTRMGDAWGSIGFGLLAHENIYEPIDQEFPRAGIETICDDTLTAFHPSDFGGDLQELYRYYARYQTSLAAKGEPVGCRPNPSKSWLLLPVDAPDPDQATLDSLPPGLNITREGIVVAGTPIGTDEFIRAHAKGASAEFARMLAPLERMAARGHPQEAMFLATNTLISPANYYARTTPARLIAPTLRELDAQRERSILRIVGHADPSNIACGPERLARTSAIVALPTRLAGAGQTKLAELSPLAFLAGFLDATPHRNFATNRGHLDQEISWAHAEALRLTGGLDDAEPESPLARTLPPDTASLLTIPPPGYEPPAHPQRALVGALHAHNAALLREMVDPVHAVPQAPLTLADAVHCSQLLARPGDTSRVWSAPLDQRGNLIAPEAFTAWANFQLGLPPPPLPEQPLAAAVGHDGPRAQCSFPSCRRRLADPGLLALDPTGSHAKNCGATAKALLRSHNSITDVLHNFAGEAGLSSTKEPETADLLRDRLTPEQCGALFPYRPLNPDLRATSARLRLELTQAWSAFDPAAPDANRPAVTQVEGRIAAHLSAVNAKLAEDRQHGGRRRTGIHPDIRLVDTSDPREPEVWVDVTQAHEACHSRAPAAGRYFIKVAAHARRPTVPAPPKDGPAVRRAEQKKVIHYEPLLRIASLRPAPGRAAPTFQPFVITPEGVLGPGAVVIVELIVSSFAKNAKRAPPRLDAIPASHLIGDFRMRLRAGLACAAARGFGKMLACASAHAFGARG